MADEIDLTDPAAIAAANAETARKLADQDISGQPNSGGDNLDAISSLDSLREEQIKKAKGLVEPLEDEAAKKAAEEAAAKKAAEEVAAKAAAEADPAKKAEADAAAARAAEEEKKRTEAEAAQKAADEAVAARVFKDSPSLAPNASERSGEAFKSVKLTAAREISRLEQEKQDLSKKLQEAEEKLKNPIPPELEQELKEHREFRAKLDVDLDPRFKEFDKQIGDANEFIYAQLRKSPSITDAVIEDIKKLGGPINVNMGKILDAVNDPVTRRLVEAKLSDIELARYNKETELAKVKSNISEYMSEREKAWQETATQHLRVTKEVLNSLTAKIEWLNPKPVDPKADAETKKAIELHNAYANHARKELDIALTDDSPEMRATLMLGMAQLFRLQKTHEVLVAELDKAKKDRDSALDQIERLKRASTSRLRDSSAPITPSTVPKKEPDYNESGASALDRLRQQKIQQQQSPA